MNFSQFVIRAFCLASLACHAHAGSQSAQLSGDWLGARPALSARGIEFSANYKGEIFGIASGGLARGTVYDGLVALEVNLDFQKLAGWQGLTTHTSFYYPHGTSGTAQYAGDLGTFSNIDFYDSFRLFEAWAQQDFFNGKLSLRAGILAIDSEFAVGGTEYSAFFMNSGFGADIAMSGNVPSPIYAIAALGVRLRFKPTDQLSLMAAAYDGNPAPGVLGDPTPGAAASNESNHHGTQWALRPDEGALLAFEIAYSRNPPEEEQSDGKSDGKAAAKEAQPERPLDGIYTLGVIYHTDRFADTRQITYSNLGSSLAPANVGSHRGDYGIYSTINQQLWRSSNGGPKKLGGFLRAMWAPQDRNFFGFAAETGLVYHGLIAGRDKDQLGIGFAYASISRQSESATRSANSADATHRPLPDFESVIELSYKASLTHAITLQPDIQYIIHPSGTDSVQNALVIGMRVELVF